MKKRTAQVLISVLLILCFLFTLTACGDKNKDEGRKKAIVIVPGLFASALYEEQEDGTARPIWDPFEKVDLWVTDFVKHGNEISMETVWELLKTPEMQKELEHLLANDGNGDGEGFLYKFTAMNEDGTSKFNIKPYAPETESRYKYGMMNAHKEIYDYFSEEYGDEYDVVVFNYDFRLDNRLNGKNLEDYINGKGYEDVILVSHSNGGLVVGSYLARSEENRNKVSLYLSYDAPYLGSLTALCTLETIENMVNGIQGLATSLGINEEIVQTAFHKQFLPLLNMFTVYQLLPTYELMESPLFYFIVSEDIHVPGKEVETKYYEKEMPLYTWENPPEGYEERGYFVSNKGLYDFYCSRPWAHMDNDVNKELRAGMADWLDYVDSFYVDTENGRKHSTELVNTYYFCGVQYQTTYIAEYITKQNGELRCYGDEEYSCTELGDGTVLLYSATANSKDLTRYVLIPYADHYDAVQRFNYYSKDTTDTIVKKYLAEKAAK